ncbi:hypothetical protein [Armatimonas rosea]|uniref:Putative membrane protein n=1 Tax=Armatimonas rosea TaxID=685828 RepID=A0A7W9W4A4_ARMRO|nr:hypothetical protein [Armatimonas rosea]MBB6048318.1 putative membrane protein [Armatimonas rosea]
MDETYDYVRKTLRAVAILATCSALCLANFGLSWAIVPLLAGLALAVVLLLGWWGFIYALVQAAKKAVGASASEKSRRKMRTTGLFLLFALVKYPLVGALIWWLTRVWSARELAAFVIGFLLLHAAIALRAVGKLLTEQGTTDKK